MNTRFRHCAAAFFIVIVALSSSPAQAVSLRAGGTGAATAMMQSIAAVYAHDTGDTIDVVPSLGSSGALNAVRDGVLDFAIVARPLTQEDEAKGLVTFAELKTPFGFVTSRKFPPGLRKTDFANLFSSAPALWPDAVPLRIGLRPRSESDTKLVGDLFPGMRDVMEQARKRSDVPVAATDQDNADLAERLSGSLIAATLTQVTMEKRALQFVEIDGAMPTLENLERGIYPYAKTFYLVAPQSKQPELRRFIAFLDSPNGRLALRHANVVASGAP